MSFKVVRTSKTRVTNLKGFGQKPVTTNEPGLQKEEVSMEESSVGDAFEELFGEAGEEVDPENQNVPKRHVRKDDGSDEEPAEDVPPKPEYSGDIVCLLYIRLHLIESWIYEFRFQSFFWVNA